MDSINVEIKTVYRMKSQDFYIYPQKKKSARKENILNVFVFAMKKTKAHFLKF